VRLLLTLLLFIGVLFQSELPQVTTEPSLLSAANAYNVEYIWVTPDVSLLLTILLFPPRLESPQVTTEPSLLSAANAYNVENIWVTPDVRLLLTLLLFPP
jgi:uncharacterized protein YlzI (FlbEa/FlbD family)